MNAQDIEAILQEALFDSEGEGDIAFTRTFEESGLLTDNRGLVVVMQDGSEFQVTIVQSKRTRRGEGYRMSPEMRSERSHMGLQS